MSLYPDLDRKYQLEPEAEAALGKVSPELAWLQVRTMVEQCREEYCGASLEVCERLTWSPELDLTDLSEVLGNWNPVRALNHVVESNPELDYQELMSEPPLKVLEAVLKTLLTNDRLQSYPRPEQLSS